MKIGLLPVMNDLVSVIIPVHNRGDLLRECLESVNAQTHSMLEVIVVDDASTEDIASVVNRMNWRDGIACRYVRSDKNGGPGNSRELGRKFITGSFVCYLDSDDYWHEEKIARQVATLAQNPQAGMCYCLSKTFSTLPLTGQEALFNDSSKPCTEFLPTILTTKLRPWCTSACIWTRESVDRIGSWSSFWNREDRLYETTAGCLGIQVVQLPEFLCFYRKSEASVLGTAQLSNRKLAVKESAKLEALKVILSVMEQHHLMERTDIRTAAGWFLYDQSLDLLRADSPDTAYWCWSEISRLISGFSPLVWLVHITRLFLRLSNSPGRTVAVWGRVRRLSSTTAAYYSS